MTRRIIAVVDDLFFASKIRGTAEQVGAVVSFPRKLEGLIEDARQTPPALIIFDLHAQRMDAVELARQLKSDERLRGIPLIGFFSHVQVELPQRAQGAGFDQVMPRSAFVNRLPELLAGGVD